MYKTKEEVERPPVWDHPCNLTRTAVKISFPAMKDEVFVNFLGYREPNLQYVMRCKGVCGESLDSQASCVPTKIVQKRVNMMIKSHLQGRDEKERWQEVEIEEHQECGCGCQYGSADLCVDSFNPQTCECECSNLLWGQEKQLCKERAGHYWDSTTCSCRNKLKKVTTRHVGDGPVSDCGYPFFTPSPKMDLLDVVSYIVLGSSATLAFFLAVTTWYYRRKYKKLLHQDKAASGKNGNSKYRRIDKQHEVAVSNKKRGGAVWKHPNKSHSATYNNHSIRSSQYCNGYATSQHQPTSLRSYTDLHLDLQPAVEENDLYHEQYDEHGVKIEKPLTDAELVSRYLS